MIFDYLHKCRASTSIFGLGPSGNIRSLAQPRVFFSSACLCVKSYFLSFLALLRQRLKMSYCDRWMSINNCFKGHLNLGHSIHGLVTDIQVYAYMYIGNTLSRLRFQNWRTLKIGWSICKNEKKIRRRSETQAEQSKSKRNNRETRVYNKTTEPTEQYWIGYLCIY